MRLPPSRLMPSIPAGESRGPFPRSLYAARNSNLSKTQPLWDPFIWRYPGNLPGGHERGVKRLIKLTRINGDPVTVNSDLIMFVEAAGETTITLSNGERMKVLEDVDRLCDLVREFKRAVFIGAVSLRGPELD